MLIQVPSTGSKTATVRRWFKQVGEVVKAGETVVELEVEEAVVALQAAADGAVSRIVVPAGKTVAAGAELGSLEPGAGGVVSGVVAVRDGPGNGSASVPAGVTPILMPQAGNTMEEGTVLKWRVKVGDRIAVGQIICEIETDKATVEMEATDAGRLAKIVAGEGAVVPVKQAIAYLAEKDADVAGITAGVVAATQVAAAKIATAEAAPAVSAVAVAAMRVAGGRVKASPAARRLAAEKGIDLGSIGAGSGPEGRILSTDLASVRAGSRPAASVSAPPVARSTATAAAKEIAAAGPMGPLSGGRKALSKMRKAIAVNLQTSKQTIPHFYVKLTINADPLFAFYRAHKPATGCTLNDVILLAVGRVVGEMAAFRSRLEGGEIVEIPAANIGVAVSVPDGLVVPVVLNIHALTLGQLAVEAKRVVESARNGKIENMGKGVFTISNMGMLGVEDFSAIINPPESGILAISGVREAVMVKDGAMRAGRVMSMTLSVDHRVVDGAVAAGFMARLRDLLESPEQML